MVAPRLPVAKFHVMGKEVLSVPEEHLAEVIRVVRAGLMVGGISEEVEEGLSAWCDEHEPPGADGTTLVPAAERVVKIGVDIGGVMSKYPEIVLPFIHALANHPSFEIHVLTDMPREKALHMLALNNVGVAPERVHSCDYDEHGGDCKARKAEELGLDMLWDDHAEYVDVHGSPPMRMFVMPDAGRDYYHPTWKTDGKEGNFGRRIQRRVAQEKP